MPEVGPDLDLRRVTGPDGAELFLAPGFLPEEVPGLQEGQPLASGVTRGGVRRLQRGGRTLWVRSYRHGGLWGRILGPLGDWFLGSRAGERELGVLAHLCAAGVRVPEPVFLEIRRAGPFRKLRLGSRELPGESLPRVLRDASERATILHAVGALVRRMHDAGVVHGDLHLGNFLYDGESPGVLDFDHATLLPSVSREERWRELLRLLRSGYKRLSMEGWGARDDESLVRGYAREEREWLEDLSSRRGALEAQIRRHSRLWS